MSRIASVLLGGLSLIDNWVQSPAALEAFRSAFLAANPHYDEVEFVPIVFGGSTTTYEAAQAYEAFGHETGLFEPIPATDNYWIDSATGLAGPRLNQALQSVQAVMDDPERDIVGLVWGHGEADSLLAEQTGDAEFYLEATERLLTILRDAAGGDLPVYLQQAGRVSGPDDLPVLAGFDLIRSAQLDLARSHDWLTIGASIYDLELSDYVHLTEQSAALAAARLVAEWIGTATQPELDVAVFGDQEIILRVTGADDLVLPANVSELFVVDSQRNASITDVALWGDDLIRITTDRTIGNWVNVEYAPAVVLNDPAALNVVSADTELAEPLLYFDEYFALSEPEVPADSDTVAMISAGDRDDEIATGAANDLIHAGAGNDTVYAGAGNDDVFAGRGHDIIVGHEGDDRLFGGDGEDRLKGDDGADTQYGGDATDLVTGDGGDDVMFGGKGGDRLFGGAGDDVVFGGSDRDVAYGDAGHDRLYGGDDHDVLYGGAGADLFDGGAGWDRMVTGADGAQDEFVFVYDAVLDQGSGRDRIEGFEVGIDKIVLENTSFAALDFSSFVRDGVEGTAISYAGSADVEGVILLEGITAAQLGDGDFVFI